MSHAHAMLAVRDTHFGDREGRGPLILENVKADAARCVDVRMVDLCLECDLRRLKRVVCSLDKKMNRQHGIFLPEGNTMFRKNNPPSYGLPDGPGRTIQSAEYHNAANALTHDGGLPCE